MNVLRYDDPRFDAQLQAVLERRAFDPAIDRAVADILADVRARGDAALVECARRFDRVELTPAQFAVPAAEIEAATAVLAPEDAAAIETACAQVAEFAAEQRRDDWHCVPRRGVRLGERFVPFARVGAYIPGGTAPLVSTVLHTVTLARVAGVPEIVVITPARPDRSVHPAILYAAACAGATEVYRLGGVYGIGALAYGTATVRRVDKIVGPGNAYVTAAKRQVYGDVALDLVAGPSEILIVADDTGDPRFIAADMLSQAEHGSGRELAVLVTTCADLIPRVWKELERQAEQLGRQEAVRRVLEVGVHLLLVDTLERAAAVASAFAPEHLEIHTARPRRVAGLITAAGAIFIGPWTPEPVGDFVAGPSHVLPTGGAARSFSGLTLEHFFRRMSVVEYSRTALRAETDAIVRIAQLEGLDAHGRAAAIRGERTPQP